jgi:hypothetical protein
MKGFLLLCAVLLCSSSLTFAQQTAPAASPATSAKAPVESDRASREDVLKYLDALHVRRTMDQMMEGMKKQMKAGMVEGFKHKLPDATPEQLAKATSLFDDVFTEINTDEMIEAIIPIYQEHISKADLQQVLAFYQSPVGQRLLAEQPAMMQESMQRGADLMKAKLPDIFKKLDERLANEFPDRQAAPAASKTTRPVSK